MWYFAARIPDCFLPFSPAPSQLTSRHSSCSVPFVGVLRVTHGKQGAPLRCHTPVNMASFRQNAAGTESTETRFYSREKDAWATLAGTECLCLVFPPCQAPPLGSACCTLRPFLTTEALLSDRLSFAIVRFPVYGARACPHSDRTQSAIIYVDVRIWSN